MSVRRRERPGPALPRSLAMGFLSGLAAVGCHNTIPAPDWLTDAPPEVGAGDCPVVV